MNRRGKTFWQRASLTKGQSRFGDLVQSFCQSLARLAPDLLAELWFDGNRLFFRAKKCGVDIASLKQPRQQKSVELHVSDRSIVALANACRLLDHRQQVWIIPISNSQSRQAGGGRHLIVVCTLLKIKNIRWIRVRKGLKVCERPVGGLVDVAGIRARSKGCHKAAPERFRVELAFFRERFEQNQGGVAVVGLISRLFSEVIMAF